MSHMLAPDTKDPDPHLSGALGLGEAREAGGRARRMVRRGEGSLREISGKGRQQGQESRASPPFCTFELEAGLQPSFAGGGGSA